MNKVKRKELVEKANEHELRLFQIEKALEQHGINWFAEEPKLKTLDQSVFDGAHEIWKFAAVDADGALFKFAERPDLTNNYWANVNCSRFDRVSVAGIYDASNWQNSLIERDKAELTGSDLCKEMLARGDIRVMCNVSNNGQYFGSPCIVKSCRISGVFETTDNSEYSYAIPINNQGEPLTATDVGLQGVRL